MLLALKPWLIRTTFFLTAIVNSSESIQDAMKVLEDEGRDREKHLFRCLLLMPAELVDIAHDASFAPF